MRAAVVAVILLPVMSACDGTHVESVGASWMEWPAEVRAATAFDVRIVGFLPSCGAQYVRRYSIDQANAAIVFAPYAIVPDEPPCVNVAPVGKSPRYDHRLERVCHRVPLRRACPNLRRDAGLSPCGAKLGQAPPQL